jgi:anti-sigma factor RsiW
MACTQTTHVHAYHDGELSPAESAALAVHLRDCAECTQTLADLQRLSALMSGAWRAPIPPETLRRLQSGWRTKQERGLLRVAGGLTAAAAAVLIGTLLVWPAHRGEGGTRPAVWQSVAVMPPVAGHDETNFDSLAMAQWMADELASEKGDESR